MFASGTGSSMYPSNITQIHGQIGLAVGGAARVIDPSKAELDFLSFNPELFFFLLLPPIIFEAGCDFLDGCTLQLSLATVFGFFYFPDGTLLSTN